MAISYAADSASVGIRVGNRYTASFVDTYEIYRGYTSFDLSSITAPGGTVNGPTADGRITRTETVIGSPTPAT